ncbi:sodium- and chloride-dependent glycine transporter 2-like [Saccostrea echinata]|uniref:sodium- and chloride-dependent glycine transporter 2-like n=1 Tax=Saccostrea echinata TaxID=191078 RepID=UPI002A803B74|nr:sodium- and chloride-dependent glycine transporter 2-like [Saccostrea echinata]
MSQGEVARGGWSNQVEFFLSCVGYAVGLGNVWRFPYLCYRNGGGAFLIPYILSLALIGLPAFFMELAFGQFASLGPITIWRVCPLFKGIGFASIIISAMVSISYNVVIAYAMYFLIVSLVNMDTNVPWATCGNDWNTIFCRTETLKVSPGMNESEKINVTLGNLNKTCVDKELNGLGMKREDLTYNFTSMNLTACSIKDMIRTPSDEFFSNFVLGLDQTDGIGGIGDLSPKLVAVLLLAWLIVFFSLKKGVKSSGKVIYFTATFPYVVLIILLVRGVTLEGFEKGLEFYLVPKFDKLTDPRVWTDAASQIFYSLGPAFGSLITMSSYNPFKNNCYRDSILVAIINCGTSVFAGLAIFSVLGFMSVVTNRPVQEVAADGPGLVFIAYPEAIARMPYPPIWAFLFFFMLILLGLSSMFAMVEAIISALADEYPRTLRRHKSVLTFVVCLALFIAGLALVTNGGIYVLTLMDAYSGSYSLLFVCFSELVAISWVYGWRRFSEDIELMLGFKPNIYWIATWTVIAPVFIVAILIASAIRFSPSHYEDYQFEQWAQNCGWGLVALPLVFLFGIAAIQLIRYRGFRNATTPHDNWGPALEENKKGKYAAGHTNKGFEEDEKTEKSENGIEMKKNGINHDSVTVQF